MKKFLVTGLFAFLCFGCFQEAIGKLKKSQSVPNLSTPPVVQNNNLKRSNTYSGFRRDDFFALTSQISSFDTYVSVLSQYLRYVGHFGAKLPVSREKIDTGVSKRMRPLIEFVDALRQGKTPKKSWAAVSSSIQSGDSGVLRDDFAKVAVIMGERLLRTRMNELSSDSQLKAHEALQILPFVIKTYYNNDESKHLLDDYQRSVK